MNSKKRYVPGLIPLKEIKRGANPERLAYVMNGIASVEYDKPNALFPDHAERSRPAFHARSNEERL